MIARDLEHAAQRDAEVALDVLEELAEERGDCLCTTCIVRVVLEAAWPHLRDLAIHEFSQQNQPGKGHSTNE